MEKKFINCEYIIVYIECSFESNSELFYVRVINSLPNKWDLFSGNEENIILIKYINKKQAFVSFHSSNVAGLFFHCDMQCIRVDSFWSSNPGSIFLVNMEKIKFLKRLICGDSDMHWAPGVNHRVVLESVAIASMYRFAPHKKSVRHLNKWPIKLHLEYSQKRQPDVKTI